MLLVHAYVAVRVGLRLFGTALLFVFSIQIGALLGIVADTAPWDSLQPSIIYFIVALCIEDSIRTWFVTSRVRRGVSVIVSSLAFSIAISFVEIAISLSRLIIAATNGTYEGMIEGGVEAHSLFFSSYSGPLVTLIIDITRPLDHFLLCISMYYAWCIRGFVLYSALVMSHIAADVILDTIWSRDPLNYVPLLGISLLFTALLFLATLWIRAVARRHSAEDAQRNSGDTIST